MTVDVFSAIVSPKKKQPSARGAFIVFEGPDRSGKSTQSKLLIQKLCCRNVPVEYMRFPDRNASNEFGTRISKYLAKEITLDKEEAHIIFTRQRLHEKEKMEKMLLSGVTLVVDRYSHSGIAYSVAKGLDLKWCCEQEWGLIKPDLVIYLDISPEVAGKRGGYGDELFETLEFQKKVCSAYHLIRQNSWKVMNAIRPQEEIINEVFETAWITIQECKTKPLLHLFLDEFSKTTNELSVEAGECRKQVIKV